MSGLRVLVTTDTIGGVWQYSIELARELGRLGTECVIAAMGPAPSDAQRAEAAAIPEARLIETDLPLDWLCDDAAPVRAAGQTIAGLAERLDVDVVHANMPTLLAEARFRQPTIAVTHGCVATWWAAAKGEPLAPQYRWHEALTARALRRADLVVAPSRSYAARVQRHYRLPTAPLAVLNGRRQLSDAASAARHDFAFTAGRLWDAVKNVAVLDRAAEHLAIPFYAAGARRGPHGESARLDNLHPLGHLEVEALAQHLAARPVFVSSARFEPFGLAVLEAAAAGCPLVLSDIDTFRELWDGAAVFVAPDDAQGFARAVEAIIGDSGRRQALEHAAAARAARYCPAATAAAMQGHYRQLIDARVAA